MVPQISVYMYRKLKSVIRMYSILIRMLMMVDNKKQQNTLHNNNHNNNGEDKDKLSALPDDILIEILSFLPTNTAATTTVLSHRWRNLWTHITAIRINKHYFAMTRDQLPIIIPLITIFFFEKLTSPVINTLDIYVPNSVISPIIINQYLTRLLSRGGLKELKLVLEEKHGKQSSYMQLPISVDLLKTMVKLHLSRGIHLQLLDMPPNNMCCFPYLQVLKLSFTTQYEAQLLTNVTKSCPSLVRLKLKGLLTEEDDHVMEISAQNLERFDLEMGDSLKRYRVLIDAPKLRYLNILDDNPLSMYNFAKKPSALVEAYVDRGSSHIGQHHHPFKDLELLGALSNSRELMLFSTILHDVIYSNNVRLPTFHHLTHLQVEIKIPNQFKGLMHFLSFLPNILSLTISSLEGSSLRLVEGYTTSNELDYVPPCLATKMEFIKLRIFGEKYELELISYFLRGGNVLRRLEIEPAISNDVLRYWPPEEVQVCKELDFYKELYKLPKNSTTCVIKFKGKFVNRD